MNTVKGRRSSATWKRRNEKMLSTLAELGGEASKEQVLQRLSTTPEYTTKGPEEPELKSPGYYLGQVLRKTVDLALVQRGEGGILCLTDKGRKSIGAAKPAPNATGVRAAKPEPTPPEVRTVDAKSRLLLPKEFANATVMVERVSETEVRIRKAVVVPADELPLVEDQLKPLSNRARDFFLDLLDNPPEPTPALLKAAKLYQKHNG